jgi:hypothetical protein
MILRTLLLSLLALLLAVAPALAKGGGGGGGGGGAGGAGAGNSSGGHGGGNGVGHGAEPTAGGPAAAPTADVSPGAGRATAISNPGSAHRSDTATQNLSAPTPGKANPPSGVTPGFGRVGTVPTTRGHLQSGPPNAP